jgi:hypothetical protein
METITFDRKKYLVRDTKCKKRECFVPFSGNGMYICRLYELGQCPEKYRDNYNKINEIKTKNTKKKDIFFIEAYGVKGMDSKRWRRAFRSIEALEKWCEDNDAEIYGTRDVKKVGSEYISV